MGSSKQTKKTRTINDHHDPTWDELLEFDGDFADFTSVPLALKVMDSDAFGSESLGEVRRAARAARATRAALLSLTQLCRLSHPSLVSPSSPPLCSSFPALQRRAQAHVTAPRPSPCRRSCRWHWTRSASGAAQRSSKST